VSDTPSTTPATTWAARLDPVRWLGPGLVMAATAIGASHLVLAPTAGAAFGWELLWLLPFAHLFKYPAFDFGPRWAVATGTSLLDGYAEVPGPGGWALWAFLLGTVVQGVTVLAGVLAVAAAVAWAGAPFLSPFGWSVVLGAIAVWVLWSGRFDALSALSKWMLLVLAAMTTLAFLATPPPAEAWAGLVRIGLPEGSIVLVAAILGWMPTGLDVSVWHSMWALERKEAWAERAGARSDAAPDRRVLGVARADLGLGYGLSFALSVMFLALGVAVLRPTGEIPGGADVAVTLARLYTEVLGTWIAAPFLLAAFFGMFSTTLGVLDGFPRAFGGVMRRILPDRSVNEGAAYWSFLLGSLVLALVEIRLLRDPGVLVVVAAVASFVLAPLTYAFNTWCVTRRIDDPSLRPGRILRLWAIAGIVCMTGATALFLYSLAGG